MSDNPEYEDAIAARIQRSLKAGAATLSDIVRACQGAYPTLVQKCLEALPSVRKKTVTAFELESAGSDADVGSRLLTLESNPALSSWYFSSEACERILQLRGWESLRLAFLGTPRLYEWFALAKAGRQRLVLDLDRVVLEAIAPVARAANDSVRQYDAAADIPEEYLNKFDAVFFDPPWYPTNYSLWLARAATLAPSGTVIFPLMPQLTRPSAEGERDHILDRVRHAARQTSVLSAYVEYEIPSFEKVELAAASCPIDRPWKIADLVIAELRPGAVGIPAKQVVPDDWREIDVGPMRVFIDFGRTVEDERFVFVPDSGSLILPSPSRRSLRAQSSNVLTSRGHGFATSDPRELMRVISALAGAAQVGDDFSRTINAFPLDRQSAELLQKVFAEVFDG
jgi:hypothetical protein